MQVFSKWHNQKKDAVRKQQEEAIAERRRKGILSGREIFAQVRSGPAPCHLYELIACLAVHDMHAAYSVSCLLLCSPHAKELCQIVCEHFVTESCAAFSGGQVKDQYNMHGVACFAAIICTCLVCQ